MQNAIYTQILFKFNSIVLIFIHLLRKSSPQNNFQLGVEKYYRNWKFTVRVEILRIAPLFRSVRKGRISRVSIEVKATCYALLKISTDIKMPAWREALASRKLNPCFTLIIFSFMVSFTLSIMDLTLRINILHLPVLVMWLITLCSVLLTVVFWYCHSSISSVLKRPRNQRPPPSPVERDRDLGRSQEAVASKLELPRKTENSSLLRK